MHHCFTASRSKVTQVKVKWGFQTNAGQIHTNIKLHFIFLRYLIFVFDHLFTSIGSEKNARLHFCFMWQKLNCSPCLKFLICQCLALVWSQASVNNWEALYNQHLASSTFQNMLPLYSLTSFLLWVLYDQSQGWNPGLKPYLCVPTHNNE